MTKVPEHQELRSHDVVADKRDELLRLFPEARTEDGRINFDTLRMVIGDVVDVGRERYGMTWPGKADSFRAIQSQSLATLRPAPDESVQFEITGNLIIEGDNLEVLKLLQKSYLGKVNMIYIDPPYNTGKASSILTTTARVCRPISNTRGKWILWVANSRHTDTQGRFHSQWLNMIYPRLYLARNLLREDGVIVISIDDAELRNLWRVCDEIFGEGCYAGCISRATGTPTGDGNKSLVNANRLILVYGRTPEVFVEGLPLSDKEAAIYDREDSQGRYLTRPLRRTGCDPDLRKMPGEFVRDTGDASATCGKRASCLQTRCTTATCSTTRPTRTDRPGRLCAPCGSPAHSKLRQMLISICVDPDNGIAKPDQMYQRRGPQVHLYQRPAGVLGTWAKPGRVPAPGAQRASGSPDSREGCSAPGRSWVWSRFLCGRGTVRVLASFLNQGGSAIEEPCPNAGRPVAAHFDGQEAGMNKKAIFSIFAVALLLAGLQCGAAPAATPEPTASARQQTPRPHGADARADPNTYTKANAHPRQSPRRHPGRPRRQSPRRHPYRPRRQSSQDRPRRQAHTNRPGSVGI